MNYLAALACSLNLVYGEVLLSRKNGHVSCFYVLTDIMMCAWCFIAAHAMEREKRP